MKGWGGEILRSGLLFLSKAGPGRCWEFLITTVREKLPREAPLGLQSAWFSTSSAWSRCDELHFPEASRLRAGGSLWICHQQSRGES